MMKLTSDQYYGIDYLDRWVKKLPHQLFKISGLIGTGAFDMIQYYVEEFGSISNDNILYISKNQRQVLSLISNGYNARYFNDILYDYIRFVDIDTLPSIGPRGVKLKYEWTKMLRKKIKKKYRLIVVLNSNLLTGNELMDLKKFETAILLVEDPMLISDGFIKRNIQSNVILSEICEKYSNSSLVKFAHMMIDGNKLRVGRYGAVDVISKKNLNLYNLKESDMVITNSTTMRNSINDLYRKKIMKCRDRTNVVGEKLICITPMYDEFVIDDEISDCKTFLHKYTTGKISRIHRHSELTKYVILDFMPDFHDFSFEDIYFDRHKLNAINKVSYQSDPDKFCIFEYAYAITPEMSIYSNWNNIMIINSQDPDIGDNINMNKMFNYTAVTRAIERCSIII